MTLIPEPISSLPLAGAVDGSEYVAIVQGGATKKTLVSTILGDQDFSAYYKKDGSTGDLSIGGHNITNVTTITGGTGGYINFGTLELTLGNIAATTVIDGLNIQGTSNGDIIFGASGYVEFAGTSGWFGTAGPSYLTGLSFDDTTGVKIQSAFDTIIYGYGTDSNLTLRNTSADLDVTGTLNLGTLNTTVVNVGTASGNTNVNIGTSGTNIIQIGNSSSTVNISGSVLYENVTNLQVSDKLFTVNKGGASSSAVGSGFEIEENSVITGYVKTTGGRDGFLFKAPANTADSSFLFSATSARSYTYQDRSYTVAGLDDINSTNIISGLGYTPENISNKATDFSAINNTKYPTTQAVDSNYWSQAADEIELAIVNSYATITRI